MTTTTTEARAERGGARGGRRRRGGARRERHERGRGGARWSVHGSTARCLGRLPGRAPPRRAARALTWAIFRQASCASPSASSGTDDEPMAVASGSRHSRTRRRTPRRRRTAEQDPVCGIMRLSVAAAGRGCRAASPSRICLARHATAAAARRSREQRAGAPRRRRRSRCSRRAASTAAGSEARAVALGVDAGDGPREGEPLRGKPVAEAEQLGGREATADFRPGAKAREAGATSPPPAAGGGAPPPTRSTAPARPAWRPAAVNVIVMRARGVADDLERVVAQPRERLRAARRTRRARARAARARGTRRAARPPPPCGGAARAASPSAASARASSGARARAVRSGWTIRPARCASARR